MKPLEIEQLIIEEDPQDAKIVQTPQPVQKICYGLSIACAVFNGIGIFIYGYLDYRDFGTSCMQFSGFLLTAVVLKLIEDRKDPVKVNFFCSLLKYYYDSQTKKVLIFNILHTIARSTNFFMLTWLTLISANYAKLANVNFGVIASCICIQIFTNSVISYFYFKEKLSIRMVIGMSIVILGIIWISLAKPQKMDVAIEISDELRNFYRYMSILCALMIGVLNSIRALQGKYVFQKSGYSPTDFSIDSTILCGIISLILSVYYSFQGHQAYTLYNFSVMSFGSIALVLASFTGLVASVRGLVGPATAIMQGHVPTTIILNSLFLQQIPSYSQVGGSILAISGVIIIMLKR